MVEALVLGWAVFANCKQIRKELDRRDERPLGAALAVIGTLRWPKLNSTGPAIQLGFTGQRHQFWVNVVAGFLAPPGNLI